MCVICGTSDFVFLFEKKARNFFQCKSCGLQLQYPLPTSQELEEYYEGSYQSGLYKEFREATRLKELTARQRLKELAEAVPVAGRWLDVGASTGIFCQEARKLGVDATGIEISKTAADIAKSNGIPIEAGRVEDLPDEEQFDCVTAFDILEHVLNPGTFVTKIGRCLTSSGFFVLTLPNLNSWSCRIMGSRWYFYLPEEHLHYFNPRTIRRFLSKTGFEVFSIRAAKKPMTFEYAQSQFEVYNPTVFRTLRVLGQVLPNALRSYPLAVPIGEMCVICRKAQGQPSVR